MAAIDGIGTVMARAYVAFFQDEKKQKTVNELLQSVRLDESFTEKTGGPLSGKTFVITGKVNHFENRDAVKAAIEAAGGKSASSVTGKTDYLINNNINSASAKNKKAAELGIPIITEEQFMEMLEARS